MHQAGSYLGIGYVELVCEGRLEVLHNALTAGFLQGTNRIGQIDHEGYDSV
jgi:hypothetical protein